MNRSTRLPVLAAAALLALAGLAGTTAASEPVTLEGGFVWERSDGNQTGDLKAVFTPTGDGTWDVAFHFDWEDGPHVYAGTAEGSLTEGELSGRVNNDSEDRPGSFVFKGTVADGSFSGTHAWLEGEEEKSTGTLTLAHPE